jgi:hypothetical protein
LNQVDPITAGPHLRLVWPQWQGAGTESVRSLAPEFPFDIARRGYSVGTTVLQAVLPEHAGPTAVVPVEMGDIGLEERDGIEAKTVVHWSKSRSGSRPGTRSASMVLPTPGGPRNSMWCLPGYFAGPLSLDLTDHICQVKTTVRMPTGPLSYYLDGLDRRNRDAAQKGDQLSDGGNTKDFNAINKLRLPGLTQCHDHPAKPAC